MFKEKMTTKFETAKTFVKEHKVEIAVTTGIVATGVAGVILGKKARAKRLANIEDMKKASQDLVDTLVDEQHSSGLIPDRIATLAGAPKVFDNGIEITDGSKFLLGDADREFTELIINNVTIDDLGELGRLLNEFEPEAFEANRYLSMIINDTLLMKSVTEETAEKVIEEAAEKVIEETAKDLMEECANEVVEAVTEIIE